MHRSSIPEYPESQNPDKTCQSRRWNEDGARGDRVEGDKEGWIKFSGGEWQLVPNLEAL